MNDRKCDLCGREFNGYLFDEACPDCNPVKAYAGSITRMIEKDNGLQITKVEVSKI